MSNPVCFQSLQVVRFRIARLTSAGAPLTGANNGYVSDSIVSLGVSVELETGDEFVQKNGSGAICATYKDCDRIKRLSLAMVLCQLDLNLVEFMLETSVFASGGNTIGFQFPSVSAACPNGVALEVWTRAWDSTQAAVPAYTSGAAAYWHWVFPKTVWQIGNITMENGMMTIPMNASATENAQITANGPFNDWPAAVSGPGGITRVGGAFLDSTIPTAQCAKITVPVGS